MIVFFLSGMWHGAHPNYLLWGVLNGGLLVAERIFHRRERKIPAALAWPVTFLLINCLWLLFRSGTIGQWAELMKHILSFRGVTLSARFTDAFHVPELAALLRVVGGEGILASVHWLPMALFMLAGFAIVLIPQNNHRNLIEKKKLSPGSAVAAGIALILSILCMSSESVFIYHGF